MSRGKVVIPSKGQSSSSSKGKGKGGGSSITTDKAGLGIEVGGVASDKGFKKAMYSARKKKKKTFSYGGKVYSTS